MTVTSRLHSVKDSFITENGTLVVLGPRFNVQVVFPKIPVFVREKSWV
jgi:hypothetical protein